MSLFNPPSLPVPLFQPFLDKADDANLQRPALRNLLAPLFGQPALVYYSLPPSASTRHIQDTSGQCCLCC